MTHVSDNKTAGNTVSQTNGGELLTIHLQVYLFDHPWRKTVSKKDPLFQWAQHALTCQDEWSDEVHRETWRAALTAWPRDGGSRRTKEMIAYHIYWWNQEGFSRPEIEAAMHMGKNSLTPYDAEARLYDQRRKLSCREGMNSDGTPKRGFRLPRVADFEDPLGASTHYESISRSALTDSEEIAWKARWDRLEWEVTPRMRDSGWDWGSKARRWRDLTMKDAEVEERNRMSKP